MSSSSRYTPKLPDKDIVMAFETVASKHAELSPTVTFHDQFGQLDPAAIAHYKKLRGFSLHGATLLLGSVNWSWQRLRPEHNDPQSNFSDKLTTAWNQHTTPDRLLSATVSSQLDTALSRPLAASGINESVQPLASHGDILLAMESVAASILTDATAHRHALELQFQKKEESLTARTDELRERELSRIAEEKSRVDEETDKRQKTLNEKQQELDDLKKKLDDRNNTHVRRDIRSGLLALVKERLDNFAISKQTRGQYYAVHIVAGAGVITAAIAAAYYGSLLSIDPVTKNYGPETIVLALKSAAFAATAIALGSWYLRWLNRWLQRIADAEFKLQQFRLDIDRASWLTETVLEWNATSSEPFPELLASRLSTGLFQSTSTEFDDPKSPAHHIADALFGAASSAKLKVGEHEVNLDRRAIKSLNQG